MRYDFTLMNMNDICKLFAMDMIYVCLKVKLKEMKNAVDWKSIEFKKKKKKTEKEKAH